MSSYKEIRYVSSIPTQDDPRLFVIRKDFSGGVNTRQHGSVIKENQATVLYNTDIGVPGETSKRKGLTLIEDLGDNAGTGAFGFEPDGGTNELLVTEGTNLQGWTGSGTFTAHKTDFTSGLQTTMIKAGESGEGDVVLISNGTDNWFRMNQSHSFQDLGNTSGTGSDSPPKSTVATYYRNRVWILKSNLLYWSDAYPDDYSTAFDTVTNAYRIPVGTEKAVIGLRDIGLIVIGADQIWGINPSMTPAATDKPEKILDIGCVAGKTAIQVADDIFFLAPDGVRGVFRTQQDKLQLGQSFPLSYVLKDRFEAINWGQISKACAVWFDGKYFIALPVESSTYNNEVWVYYPALGAWMVITGWNVGAWAKLKVNGEERLYYIDSNDGSVYRAWTGADDAGTAVNLQIETRKEDFGQPLRYKTGGEVEVKAVSIGDYDVDVYAELDDGGYTLLGQLNLTGNAPTLPATLPFTLVNPNVVSQKFHLDNLGRFKTIRLKLQHNALNGSDIIKILETNIITFLEEYENE